MTADFEVQIAHSIEDIGPQTWGALVDDRRFASFSWYQFAEKVMADDQPVYVLLHREGAPVACSTFWLKRREVLPLTSPIINAIMQQLVRRWPLLICRSPLASTSGLILQPQVQPQAALAAMTAAACNFGQLHRVSFVLYDYLDNGEINQAEWPVSFSPVVIPNPGTFLDVDRPDFESYLESLKSSARKDYRRHHNRAVDRGITVTAHREITQIEEALVLIRNVEQHHGTPPNPYTRNVLEHAHLVDPIWLMAHINDRLVGCGLLLRDQDALLLTLLGLDYEERYIYFQLVYAAIREGISSGCRVLRGGGGAYEIKTRLGFEIESQNHVMISSTHALLRQVIRSVPTG